MELIEHYEVPSGGVSEIEFTSIPDTFTDLLLVTSLRTTETAQPYDLITMSLNSSTSNRTFRNLLALNTSVFSDSGATLRHALATSSTATSNTFSNDMSYFPNYAGNTAKSISSDGVYENNATANYMILAANLWNDTAAINSITLVSNSASNFVEYSSATLYGITAGSDGIVAVS
jgi:hypothetical protein